MSDGLVVKAALAGWVDWRAGRRDARQLEPLWRHRLAALRDLAPRMPVPSARLVRSVVQEHPGRAEGVGLVSYQGGMMVAVVCVARNGRVALIEEVRDVGAGDRRAAA
jgi:hypothetical protein